MALDEKNDCLAKTEEILERGGYTLSDLIEYCGQRNSKLLMLDDDNYNLFSEIYLELSDKKVDQYDKGKKLEEITFILFEKSVGSFFDVYHNCRTSTNEIDLLIRWSENARLANINNAFSCFGESFLCECKNYKRPVSVTYVGKFCSLMAAAGTDMGIMISWEGVSGKGNWEWSKGLIKKIALCEKRYIIVIDQNDLKQIYEKKANIFSIVYDKYIALKNDIDYSRYIKVHEAQEKLAVK